MAGLVVPAVSTSGDNVLVERFDEQEGCWCVQEWESQCLDCPISDEEYAALRLTRYGHANDEVPPRSMPETGGKCFVSWASDVAAVWDEFTDLQRNQAFLISAQVYPDGNLFAELEDRL